MRSWDHESGLKSDWKRFHVICAVHIVFKQSDLGHKGGGFVNVVLLPVDAVKLQQQ